MNAGGIEPEAFNTALAWLERRLDDAASADFAALVESGDPAATQAVAWLRQFRSAAALAGEPVPDAVAKRLRSIAVPEATAAGPDRQRSWRDRLAGVLRATVSFDSLQGVGAAMARSAADSTRQLVLSGPGIDIAVDLERSPAEPGYRAAVQLLPVAEDADPGNVPMQAWASTGLVAEGQSDQMGRVDFTGLPASLLLVEVGASPNWPTLVAEVDLRQSA